MRVVHLCFLGPFTEGWSYQDNLLTKHHSLNGDEVVVIANCFKHIPNGDIVKVNPVDTIIENNIRLIRIDYKNRLLGKVSLLRVYKILNLLKEIKPDIIFCHGLGSKTYLQLRLYCRDNPDCKVVGDTHIYAELENYGKTLRTKLGILYMKTAIKKTDYLFDKYYYVTPSCRTIAVQFWKVNPNKMELLPLGYDDEIIDISKKTTLHNTLIEKYKLPTNSILVATGGKLNEEKNIHILTKYFHQYLTNNLNSKIYLFIFGSFAEEWIKDEIMKYVDDIRVFYCGFFNQKEICDLLLGSDAAIYPGGQSVLWQCAIGCGTPIFVKLWKEIDYLNFNDNAYYIKDLDYHSFDEVFRVLDSDKMDNLKKNALSKKRELFSYRNEAKRIVEE